MLKEYKRVTVADNCMGCFACEVACKQEHSLPVGPRWIRVFPDVREVGEGGSSLTWLPSAIAQLPLRVELPVRPS